MLEPTKSFRGCVFHTLDRHMGAYRVRFKGYVN